MTTTAATIADLFDFASTRQRVRDLLDLLHTEGPFIDRSGSAGVQMFDRLQELHPDQPKHLRSASNKMLHTMEREGWIVRDVRGKRTISVAVGPTTPSDYHQPYVTETGHVITDEELEEFVAEAERGYDVSHLRPVVEPRDEEATELGMRPGRLAARIERQVPELVKAATMEALNEWLALVAGALGYAKPGEDRTAEVERELEQVAATLAQVNEELRNERIMGDAARRELNALLVKSEKLTGHSLRPSDMPKVWRELATAAIKAGFVIRMTNGDHFAWIAPGGERYHSGNTPSDWRAVKNAKAALERMGLPK